jgi:hypothetical protein
MSERMTNEHGHDSEKGNDIELPAEDLERDGDEPAWSPDNELSKEKPTLGNIPENEGGPAKT